MLTYIWMMAQYSTISRYDMHQQTVYFMLGWLLLCFTGIFGPVANTQHVVGFLLGIAWGYFRSGRGRASRRRRNFEKDMSN